MYGCGIRGGVQIMLSGTVYRSDMVKKAMYEDFVIDTGKEEI